jgi:hypothetical protein
MTLKLNSKVLGNKRNTWNLDVLFLVLIYVAYTKVQQPTLPEKTKSLVPPLSIAPWVFEFGSLFLKL